MQLKSIGIGVNEVKISLCIYETSTYHKSHSITLEMCCNEFFTKDLNTGKHFCDSCLKRGQRKFKRMYQWAINTKDSFFDAAIVYLNHETNGTAYDKGVKHMLCEFSYLGGRDAPSFKNITVIVMINHRVLYTNPILQWRFYSGRCQMALSENKLVCEFYCLFFLVSSFNSPEEA